MSRWCGRYLVIIALLVAVQATHASVAQARNAAPFSFDSVWFYRDAMRVVPEIGRTWITVGFDRRYAAAGAFASFDDNDDNRIQRQARKIVKSHGRLAEYLYDPNLAADACFFRVRKGLRLQEIGSLVTELKQEKGVRYVHPTVVIDNKTFAYFDAFDLEWKTGIPTAQRQALLAASHARVDEKEENGKGYLVDLATTPYFRALNLLAEDIRVLKVTPRLVEIKQSISTTLAFLMGGANIGDSVPFTLTIAFSDRVNIDPSSIATLNLRPPELQKELFDCTFDPYDYAKAVTKSPIVITGRVRFFAPGEFTIPALKIHYTCPTCDKGAKGPGSAKNPAKLPAAKDAPPATPAAFESGGTPAPSLPDSALPPAGADGAGGTDGASDAPPLADGGVRSMETEPVLFKVASIIPADRSEYRLVVPSEPAPVDFRIPALHRQSVRHLWLGLASLAALILCIAALVFLRFRFIAERDRLKERRDHVQLGARLRDMLQTQPGTPHWRYLCEVGVVLREYLLALGGVDAHLSGGSAREFMDTIGGSLPPECVVRFDALLAAIDESVALETEYRHDMDQLRYELLQALEATAIGAAAAQGGA